MLLDKHSLLVDVKSRTLLLNQIDTVSERNAAQTVLLSDSLHCYYIYITNLVVDQVKKEKNKTYCLLSNKIRAILYS